jgi:hypothetical protein
VHAPLIFKGLGPDLEGRNQGNVAGNLKLTIFSFQQMLSPVDRSPPVVVLFLLAFRRLGFRAFYLYLLYKILDPVLM